MFSAVKISSIVVDVSIADDDVSWIVVNKDVLTAVVVVCSVDASVVKMNLGSRIGLGDKFLLRALTMMPPSIFFDTVFDVVTESFFVVVVVGDIFDVISFLMLLVVV